MTREEAIRRLTNIERHIAIHTEQDKRDFSALEMAISALEEKPCIYDLKNRYCPKLDEHGVLKHQEQEPITTTNNDEPITMIYPTIVCDDAISRQAVLDLAKKGILVSNGNYKSVCKAIDALPSVTQKSKTGHWIWCVGSHKCSNCEEYTCFSHKELLKYCPNCGARMVEPQESEEQTE